jgi:transposase InsO family protein
MKNLHELLKREHILRLTNVHFEKAKICIAFLAGKQVGVHHPHKNIMTTDMPLELLHMDLFGSIAYISIGGSKYCLVIVDDYSRFTWIFFLQVISQTQETLKRLLRRAQNEFRLRIKKIRSDNRTEFKNSQIEGFLEEVGIKHEFSSPYTPQQNGVVERKNRTLLDMARTMLDEFKTRDWFGWKQLTPLATQSTISAFTESSKKHHMNSSQVKSLMFLILEFFGANASFLLKEVEILNLILK